MEGAHMKLNAFSAILAAVVRNFYRAHWNVILGKQKKTVHALKS
jgi:hypothetical protein